MPSTGPSSLRHSWLLCCLVADVALQQLLVGDLRCWVSQHLMSWAYLGAAAAARMSAVHCADPSHGQYRRSAPLCRCTRGMGRPSTPARWSWPRSCPWSPTWPSSPGRCATAGACAAMPAADCEGLCGVATWCYECQSRALRGKCQPVHVLHVCSSLLGCPMHAIVPERAYSADMLCCTANLS